MARQSITLANQNDEWLKEQVAKEEFTSKSDQQPLRRGSSG